MIFKITLTLAALFLVLKLCIQDHNPPDWMFTVGAILLFGTIIGVFANIWSF